MKAKPKPSGARKLYQLKVTLVGSEPPIWRRFEVPDDITLGDLHYILQIVMGWKNAHLYEFTKDRKELPDNARLAQVAPRARSKFIYLYDMGDSWAHEILVEKTAPFPEGQHCPICLDGQRACPPEDSGGVWGYDEMLDAVKDPGHPDHEDFLEWLGDDFDPEAFHLKEINKRLKRYKI